MVLSAILAGGVPAAADTLGKSILKQTRLENEVSANRRYGYSKVRGFSRLGTRAQRFEIHHGDCGGNKGWDDCSTDRQRVERKEDPKDFIQREGAQVWYGWSLFLDPNYPDLGTTNAAFGQVKMRNWRSPIWIVKLKNGRATLNLHAQDDCYLGSLTDWRGKWIDFTLFADYDLAPSGPSLVLYINGEKACTYSKPLITKAMAEVQQGDLYMKYGIYNSYVSRWLNQNKTKPVEPESLNDQFKLSGGTQGAASSPAANPFNYDWGVELPIQVAYYDEMRFGRSREEVDVRLIEARQGKPVD